MYTGHLMLDPVQQGKGGYMTRRTLFAAGACLLFAWVGPGARADSDNRVACHHDGTVVVDMSLAVHGYNRAAGDDRVGVLLRSLSVEKNREAKVKRAEQRENIFEGHP